MGLLRKLFGLKKDPSSPYEAAITSLESRKERHLRSLEDLKQKEEFYFAKMNDPGDKSSASQSLAQWTRLRNKRLSTEEKVKKIQLEIEAMELNQRFYVMVQSSLVVH